MTNARKKELQKKMRSECNDALHALAESQELYVTSGRKGSMIRGPHGYISDLLHGDGAHNPDFEPGYGKEEDWASFFKNGPYLSYTRLGEDGVIENGDNFNVNKPKEVRETLKLLRILPL
jgi:hypothetical protein